MNDIPEGYYLAENGMLKMKEASEQPTTSPQMDAADLDRINLLDHSGLVTLVRRMACQCGLVANMTDDETAQAMLDELAHTALKPLTNVINIKADIANRMAAIDKWLDRKQGKSMQRIESKSIVATVDITAQREAAQQQALEYMQRLAKAKSISSITDQTEKAKDDKSIT